MGPGRVESRALSTEVNGVTSRWDTKRALNQSSRSEKPGAEHVLAEFLLSKRRQPNIIRSLDVPTNPLTSLINARVAEALFLRGTQKKRTTYQKIEPADIGFDFPNNELFCAYTNGWSQDRIADELGISRHSTALRFKTARKYLIAASGISPDDSKEIVERKVRDLLSRSDRERRGILIEPDEINISLPYKDIFCAYINGMDHGEIADRLGHTRSVIPRRRLNVTRQYLIDESGIHSSDSEVIIREKVASSLPWGEKDQQTMEIPIYVRRSGKLIRGLRETPIRYETRLGMQIPDFLTPTEFSKTVGVFPHQLVAFEEGRGSLDLNCVYKAAKKHFDESDPRMKEFDRLRKVKNDFYR